MKDTGQGRHRMRLVSRRDRSSIPRRSPPFLRGDGPTPPAGLVLGAGLAVGLVLAACGPADRPAGQDGAGPATTAYTGATLLDGTGAVHDDAVLVVEDDRVTCAGPASDCTVPAGADAVDLSGRFVTPGLIDAHVHFAQTAWADGRPDGLNVTADYPYAEVVAARESEPDTYYRSYLCSGVTGVFDVGGFPWSWDLRDDASTVTVAGGMPAPHVAAAGPLLTWVPPRMSLPAEQVMVQITGEDQGRRAVGYVAAFDTDAVKVWFLGVPEAQREQIDAAVLAIGDEARARQVPLIVHATSLREAKVAVQAGAHLLVHSVQDQPVDQEFLNLARDAGTVYTPTLIVGENWAAMYESAATGEVPEIDDPNGCVDPETRRKILSTPEYGDHPTLQSDRFSPEALEARREAQARGRQTMAENLLAVHEAGITVAMGTDAGNPFTTHGPSVHAEMERMQAADVPPADIVVMATRNAARAMGRAADVGTLVPGKVADFLVLAEDPREDVSAFRSLESVVRGGIRRTVEDLAYR